MIHALALAVAMRPAVSERCQPFSSSLPETAACERANGTLESFSDPNVSWRVRYFVRYEEMPCGEFPTEQEAYVFHMVINDLTNDTDLNDYQRIAIRNAMYQPGTTNCNHHR